MTQETADSAGAPPRYMRRNEAAEYLKETWGVRVATGTLMKLASVGGGGALILSGPDELPPFGAAVLPTDPITVSKLARLLQRWSASLVDHFDSRTLAV